VSGRKGGRQRRLPLLWAAMMLSSIGGANAAEPPVEVVGDAIPRSLSGAPGDPARGRAIVVERQRGLCLLCHSGPFPEERFQGNLAPDLGGAGARWSEGQLRLRLVDSSRLNPDTVMPPYFRTDHLKQVARAWEGKTVLTAQEIEDVISFLKTLQ
jgi:sulfur-oxidizing protein SoxX